ncbi:hypothetical protein J5X84_15240 [Streptosporangiaceae bacterium NEAU-GS5]|nr:hypothetical protein [Streptosporangiaceae bacterium NEAU-GS5]
MRIEKRLKCLVIANPAAGQADRSLVDDVAKICAAHGAEVRIAWTARPGHAVRLACDAVRSPARDSFQVVVSVGGDGTTREVACGLVVGGASAARHALLVVPAGTGNSTYRGLWGDRPWQEAAELALADPAGWVHRLDLARVAESKRLVVLGAGAGLTAKVIEGTRDLATSGTDAELTGPARLQAGLQRALAGFRPYPGRVTVDGTVLHEGPTLFANVGGGRYRAWHYQVLPRSVPDDGLLDVCVVGAGVGVEFAELQARLREGAHLDLPDVFYRSGRRVVIERTDGEPLCFEHDGDLVPDPGQRATLEVRPRLLPVLCDLGR